MRARRLLLAIVCAGLPAAGRADDSFPYSACINADGAEYRSGPGRDYYACGALTKGQAVEVYRHDLGGWCAIRPPDDSFSWVPADKLSIGEDGLASVLEAGVEARVGSLLHDARSVRQVKLKRGEQVQILATVPFGSQPDAPDWCKISPPAGEFRWVNEKQLDRGVRLTAAAQDDPDADVQLAGYAEQDSADGEAGGEKQWFKQTGGSPDPRMELDAINLALAATAAADPSEWSFDELRTRAEGAWERARTAEQRDRAKRILKQIDRFERIQERQAAVQQTAQQLAEQQRERQVAEEESDEADVVRPTIERKPARTQPRSTAARPARRRRAGMTFGATGIPAIRDPQVVRAAAVVPLEENAASSESPDLETAADGRPFDGAGRLTRVISKGVGSPQYALLDKSGRLRSYVSAAPGVNLQRYLGHEVGVTGLQGYLPEMAAQHVMAKRVTLLENK